MDGIVISSLSDWRAVAITMVTIKTLDGGAKEVSEGDLDGLRGAIKGDVVLPDDEGYADATRLWNGMIDKRPAVIVQPVQTEDVRHVVDFARERSLLLSVRGGGHNVAGTGLADGALALDMSNWRDVDVDADARIAHIDPGCMLQDVDQATQEHGLAAVLGIVSETGVAGLTLGGGFGYLTRRCGWAVDNLEAVEIVTADGQVRRASADENPDLFWALRGGGGNFGVVTRFDHRLHPLGPDVVSGLVFYSGDEAVEILAAYRKAIAEVPEAVASFFGLVTAPPEPFIPAANQGKLAVLVGICHTGEVDQATAESEVAPLRNLGTPLADLVEWRPYAEHQQLLNAANPSGNRYYEKSEMLASLESDALEVLLEQAKKHVSPLSALLVVHVAGALNRIDEDAVPMGNRDAAHLAVIVSQWESEEHDEANIGWARETWAALRPFATGGVYVNFLTEDEGDDRLQDAYRKTLDRLRQVKARYDPDNLFRVNRNITPAADGA